jgi:hypothetical protein
MLKVLLRQTKTASLSAEDAETVVRSFAAARVLGKEGKNLLIDFDPCELEALRQRLPGWLAVEQGPPTPVPDTCLHPDKPA